jgi:hypothetical protein
MKILNIFKGIHDLIKDEKNIYDTVLYSSIKYEEEKQKMNQYIKSFNEKMNLVEDSVKSIVINNISKKDKQIAKLDKNNMNDAIAEFIKYKTSVVEANKKRNDFNKKQNLLLSIYQKAIMAQEAKLYKEINNCFYFVQKTEYVTTEININKTKDKKKVDIKEYNKRIITPYMSDSKPDEEIQISSYYLKQKPYPTSQDSTADDVLLAHQISDEMIRIMRKTITDNFPECDLQIQESSIELPDIINDYLNVKIEPTYDVKNEIIKLIRNDITIYPQLIIMLSKLRANSQLIKSKNNHIQFLEQILEEILVIAEDKKDYNAAKNCILLSQTYFIKNEETNQRQYLFERIKKNKWINTTVFWREFINKQLIYEFNRFESLYPDEKLDLLNNNAKTLPKKMEARVKEIMFTSLLSHTSNMMDLNLDKKIILKILDEFVNKYKYLDEDSIQELYKLISPDKEEIANLRKEYQENTNLENELIYY